MFDYGTAFARNLGWLSADDQKRIKRARVAIAGMGGVGGAHLVSLTRLGVSKFVIADFDDFAIQNFNRQAGAFVSTLGQPKVEVMSRIARDINPECEITQLEAGVTPQNLSTFLDGVDVYVDGIDFFAIEARRMVFAACHARGIPAITAAPLGLGAALLYFRPGGMSFEEYFRLEGHERTEQLARFIAGLSPAMLQRNYLVAPETVDFAKKRAPSTVMACDLCAGLMGTAVMKVLTKRGELPAAPRGMQFDAYHHKLVHTWRPGGNANPLQWLLLKLIRPRLKW